MQIYAAASPSEEQEAGRYCRALAHMAYRIGPDSTLLRRDLPLQARGGLLSFGDRDAPMIGDPQALCDAVLRECSRRSYGGVLLDFEERPRRDRLAFVERLAPALSAGRRALYLPESYAAAARSAIVLIGTALSGGDLGQRLREAAEARGGAAHLALDVERLRMDFRLPARTGEGEPLEAGAFRRLLEREQPPVFFSPDLCARYFTYSRSGETHFVLFDDGDTLRRKIRTGASMGFSAAFVMWPEVRDVAEKLFAP